MATTSALQGLSRACAQRLPSVKTSFKVSCKAALCAVHHMGSQASAQSAGRLEKDTAT